MDSYVLDTSFWDVIWWMIIGFFFIIVISMFIQIFADIFTRRDLNGFGKAGWSLFILILPLLGILIYLCFRPRPTAAEVMVASGYTPVDQLDKANQLLQSGAITQEEYDEIKRQTLS